MNASTDTISQNQHVVKKSRKNVSEQTETPEFKEWFGDSKVVNADGTPKVVYHGTPEQLTVFDKKKTKYSGLYGKGFYFTDSGSHANQYGDVMAVYLDIKHPLKADGLKVSQENARRFLEAIAENEDEYSIENYGTYDIDEILGQVNIVDTFRRTKKSQKRKPNRKEVSAASCLHI